MPFRFSKKIHFSICSRCESKQNVSGVNSKQILTSDNLVLSQYSKLLIGLVCILIYILYCLDFSEQFLSFSLLSLPFLALIRTYDNVFDDKIKHLLEIMGKYSMEIYISNCLIMFFIRNLIQLNYYHKYIYIIPYFALHFLLVPLIVILNRKITETLR